jgi:hypothetical protein
MSSCGSDPIGGTLPGIERKEPQMTRRLIATLAVGTAVLATAAASFASSTVTKLHATIGPGSAISVTKNGVRVKSLRPGTYRLVISDRSAEHNLVLERGSSVRHLTSGRFVGTRTVTVALARGTWRFDDRGAGREAEPGDDRGGHGEPEPGDDHGGHGGHDG